MCVYVRLPYALITNPRFRIPSRQLTGTVFRRSRIPTDAGLGPADKTVHYSTQFGNQYHSSITAASDAKQDMRGQCGNEMMNVP